ncbi:ROK family protein [Umezawaea endophytica]|uniref:ROK family protein n=1 Tax=Umezawaea endophytica TaxID=1654476 RepID=A0A9X2VJ02_9PSEU|nr:ROK family protein [Umezawaea endophytica]MCS7477520.1 ROK family protein [Umezawaea endophytica]
MHNPHRVLVGDGRRTSNAAAVLRSVLDNGPVARSTIARLTGLSAAAVTRQYAELAGLGLLREVDNRVPRATIGRPHIPVDIDVDQHVVCGVHIAFAHTTVALVDLRGRVRAREREPHAGTGPTAVLTRAADRVPDFLARHADGRTPLGVGVAIGGWVDPASGVVVRHSQLGWHDVAARDLLHARVGLPVHVESHSRALARAEQMFGDARARTSLVHLFVGNVVDAAIATGGAVHHGPRSAAGDIAHLPVDGGDRRCPCGRTGCLEAEVSDRSVAERAAAAGIITAPVLTDLLDAAVAGDRRAVELFRTRARQVGRVAALLLDVINPDVLVVTELGSIHLPECLADLHEVVAERSRRDGPEQAVVTTSFGADVLSVAAGAVVLHHVYERPLELHGNPATSYFQKSQN